jgi:hypothetical protein
MHCQSDWYVRKKEFLVQMGFGESCLWSLAIEQPPKQLVSQVVVAGEHCRLIFVLGGILPVPHSLGVPQAGTRHTVLRATELL